MLRPTLPAVRGAFFREPYHCALFARSVLPELARRPGRCLQIWSAGCASGEEAWSIAMIVEEAALPCEVAIVATDRDPAALARAGEAVYRDDQMRGVSAERRR